LREGGKHGMRALGYHENIQRGSLEFPLEYYDVDEAHPRYEMPFHWHEEAELLHILTGTFRLAIDDCTHLLVAGDVAYIAPGCLHGGEPSGCVYECVVYDMRLLLKGGGSCAPYIADLLSGCVAVNAHFPAQSQLVREAVLPLFAALRAREEGWALTTLGCLYRFVGEVYRLRAYERRTVPAGMENRKVLQLKCVFELMEERYREPLTLGQLSATVGMSPKYFCRFFKEATHRTPMEYLSYYRIEMACYEMATTDKNVTEIAMDIILFAASKNIRE
ncbi:MAG: AraC family transcriptional regulator, partial [Clostridia bacterium]